MEKKQINEINEALSGIKTVLKDHAEAIQKLAETVVKQSKQQEKITSMITILTEAISELQATAFYDDHDECVSCRAGNMGIDVDEMQSFFDFARFQVGLPDGENPTDEQLETAVKLFREK